MAESVKQHKKRLLFQVVLVATVIVAILGFVAYDFWMVEQKTQALLGAPGVAKAGQTATGEKASEGSETEKVPVDALVNYKVADDAPRAVYISKLGVAARILPMGVHSDNTIMAPKNIYDSGWYTGSAKPGEAGAMFIDGHASGATREGLFGSLDTLQQGDIVQVERGDMTRLSYRVVHVETVALAEVDMKKALAPYKGVEKGLNLMTCTGTWVHGAETLDHRVVVYTQQIEV